MKKEETNDIIQFLMPSLEGLGTTRQPTQSYVK
jgi:hypothetical protein